MAAPEPRLTSGLPNDPGSPSAKSGLPRRSFLGAGLAASLAALAGCADQSIGGHVDLPHGPDLVVGACLELTGANGVAGNSALHGIQVALDEINAEGLRVAGKLRKIQLVVKDSRSSPDTAVAQISELITTNQVMAVIGGAVTATSTAMSPVAEKRQVPMISLAAADSIVKPVPQHRFVFKLGPDASSVAELLMDRMRRSGVTVFSVLAEDGPHGDAGIDALTDAARTATIAIAKVVRLPLDSLDYTAQAAQVLASHPKPTDIVIWSQAPVAVAAATAIRKAVSYANLYFDTGAVADDAVDPKNNQFMGNSMFVAPLIMSPGANLPNTPTNYEREQFFTDFNRRYGLISSYAVFGGDALQLIATAAQRSSSTAELTRLRLRNGLESAPFALYGGAYTFSTINHGGVEANQLAVLKLVSSGWSRF